MKNNILKNIGLTLLSVIFLTTVVSCERTEPIPDDSGVTVEEITGGWWIIALEPDGTTPADGGDYEKFDIYNASANDLTFWLDDHASLKAKATVNLNNLTFSSEADTPELYTNETVSITNGTISKNAYTTTTGTVVDEIMFEAEFSSEPGVVFIFKGHKNSGKVDDLNPHY